MQIPLFDIRHSSREKEGEKTKKLFRFTKIQFRLIAKSSGGREGSEEEEGGLSRLSHALGTVIRVNSRKAVRVRLPLSVGKVFGSN